MTTIPLTYSIVLSALLAVIGFGIPYIVTLWLFGAPRFRYVIYSFLLFIPFLFIQGLLQKITLSTLSKLPLLYVVPVLALFPAFIQEPAKLLMIKLFRVRSRSDASGIGLGLGALEIVLVGAFALLLAVPHLPKPIHVTHMALSLSLVALLAPIERMLATLFHVATSVLIFVGLVRKRLGQALATAVALHYIVDTLALTFQATLNTALLATEYVTLTIIDTTLLYALSRKRTTQTPLHY